MQEIKRGTKRTISGTVTSDKMDKTVVVTIIRRFQHKKFRKFVTRRVKYKAHDENNTCRVGDVVELVESRSYSKSKKWRVSKTVSYTHLTLPTKA